MIRAILVDDEVHAIRSLEAQLSEHGGVQIIARCKNITEAKAALLAHVPDVLFLDVELPGQSGLEMLAEMREFPFDVIFTTAYERYAIQAIKASALDFLLKPIRKDDLAEALSRLEKKQKKDQMTKQVEVLMQHYLSRPDPDKSIAVPTLHGLEFIRIKDIIHLQAEGSYTKIYFDNKTYLTVSRALKYFEEFLIPEQFLRVHSSHLINLRQVKRYIKGAGGTVVMQDGTEIDVSRNKKEEFLQIFNTIRI